MNETCTEHGRLPWKASAFMALAAAVVVFASGVAAGAQTAAEPENPWGAQRPRAPGTLSPPSLDDWTLWDIPPQGRRVSISSFLGVAIPTGSPLAERWNAPKISDLFGSGLSLSFEGDICIYPFLAIGILGKYSYLRGQVYYEHHPGELIQTYWIGDLRVVQATPGCTLSIPIYPHLLKEANLLGRRATGLSGVILTLGVYAGLGMFNEVRMKSRSDVVLPSKITGGLYEDSLTYALSVSTGIEYKYDDIAVSLRGAYEDYGRPVLSVSGKTSRTGIGILSISFGVFLSFM